MKLRVSTQAGEGVELARARREYGDRGRGVSTKYLICYGGGVGWNPTSRRGRRILANRGGASTACRARWGLTPAVGLAIVHLA
jgi:hypothetical protein